ncbi:KH domain-containing protein [Salix suchowensis]|nr:KH domain-containing protein [Salix suchowensis]
MYKFNPKEEISLEATVPEPPPSIIIPSDVPIYQSFQGYGDMGSSWPVYSSTLPVVPSFGNVSQYEELIIRGGSTIKSIRQASGARIEVDDTRADRDECIITVTASESPDDLKSMAVEAILLLQGKINDEDDDTVGIRLLVLSKVIGCIIGKGGSTINEIRKRTNPNCADSNDELVEVVGEVSSVRDALVQIVLRLRDDVLKEKDGGLSSLVGTDSVYPVGAGLSIPPMLPSVPPVAPMGYDQRSESGSGLGLLSSSSLYGYGSLPMVENSYGSLAPYSSSKLYAGLPPPSTLEMLVPANAVGKVMGKGGANIANIRKISGAMIEISNANSARGDRIAHISGTLEQKRAAENLIQAFIMAT